ncbi:MAG: hypothetical protein EOM92_18865, partial [Gammaproteobacteria bacterium]|nr:hypothetical protein [Gammaproteobacteria bacterium]
MTSAGLLLAALTLVATTLAWLVLRWIRAIPVAHAWNPDTHDKLTSYALELLQREQELLESKEKGSGPTLLGWVLSHCGHDLHFRQHFVEQLRRGSVDEDMNSDLWTALRPLWNLLEWFAGHPYGEPAFTIMLRTLDRDEALEGANGGYHFFNPSSEVSSYQGRLKGLSDPVLVALLLRKLEGWAIKGTADVMPSAWQRASRRDEVSRDWWSFDREKRNYTFQDADDYYAHGYSHLAAYAMGRVLHLLQDMAVPAHVRDDSHLGIGGDNTDPLEHYAADTDWSTHFGTGDLENVKVRWHFSPDRSWLPDKQPTLLQAAASIYPSLWDNLKGKDYNAYFVELAGETHDQHYSYGTIPGNADAHDPDNPKRGVPWCPPGKADYTRCRVNVRALIELFDLTGVRAMLVLMPQAIRDATSASWSEPAPGRPDNQPVLDAVGKLRDLAQTLGARADADLAAVQSSDLLSLIHAYEELYHALDVRMPAQLGPGEPLAIFIRYHQYLNLDLLKKTLRPGRPAEDALKEWLAGSDPVQVARAYQGIHGPYCIANHVEKPKKKWLAGSDPVQVARAYCIANHVEKPKNQQDLVILKPQYVDCEARAIAYTAACLVKWFEIRYAPDNGLGIAIWRNSDAPHSRADTRLEPFDRSVDGRVSNDQQVPAAGRTLTLGIAN